MLFNSLDFLVFFLIVFIVNYTLNKKYRNYFILFSSYIFYSFWNIKFSLLILASTIIDFFCSKRVSKKNGKIYLYLSIISNISILVYFKYSIFILNLIFFNTEEFLLKNIILPVGISFYTFQSMSYTIDCYNNKISPIKSFPLFALYVSYFPQLVAGPIERAKRLLPQFSNKRISFAKLKNGFTYILIGLTYKIVFADSLSGIVDTIFLEYENKSSGELILGLIYFGCQIYGDFCGYSLIALGTSKMLGINLINNFNKPYISESIELFWKNWHISLSQWFRDYVYFPLGGNKKNKNINLMITFLVSGLWHGANLTFIFWGAYHGLLRCISSKILFKNKIANVLITFILINIGWVFFRSEGIQESFLYLRNIFFNWRFEISYKSFLIYPLALYLLELIPSLKFRRFIFEKNYSFMLICFVLLIYHLSNNKTDFIYFQF